MKNLIILICWWLIPVNLSYGHFYNASLSLNIGMAACIMLMLVSIFASTCLLIAGSSTDSTTSQIDIKAIRRSTSGVGKWYSLFCLLVMLVVLAGCGWVFLAVTYFVVNMYAWFCNYLFLELKDKREPSSES